MVKVKNTGTAPLGANQSFRFSPSPRIRLVELITHPGTGLVGAGDAAGR